MNIDIMGPVDKSWCNIIWILGIFIFFLTLIGLVVSLFKIFKGKNKVLKIFLILFNTCIGLSVYILYRVLYQMCIKTL